MKQLILASNIYKKIYYEELAHTIMEADKSYNLASASWKPMKAGDVVTVWVQRPKN